MTKGKKLLVMLLVLAMVSGTAAAVRSMDAEEAAEEAVQILHIDETAVTSFGWQFDDTEYLFLREDSGWIYPADESFPVSSTTLSELIECLNGMKAEKVLTDVKDLDEYGLEEPECVVTIAADTVYTVSMGGESAMGGSRYVTLDGQTVYMTDDGILSDFTVELYSMLRQESIPVFQDITAVSIVRGNETIMLRRETDEAGSTVWHGLAGKEELLLDTELTEEFLDDIRYLYWSNTVAHNANDKARKDYGLTKPGAVLTITYGETEQVETGLTDSDGDEMISSVTVENDFVLELGDPSEYGVYACLQDSSMVYEVNEAYAYEITSIQLTDLLPAEA